MRRFVILVALFLVTIPFGISISGCGKKTAAVVYCSGGDSGPIVGQLQNITLQPRITGISLNVGEQGQISAPSATDCKGSAVSVSSYIYSTTDMTIADVQPTTGKLCGGTWNRNTGGGIADYTTCIPTGKTGTAYITAAATGGAVGNSNSIPVYIHPIVTSLQLGPASSASDPLKGCGSADPATNCSPAATTATSNNIGCTILPNGCCSTPIINTAPAFNPNACVSQGQTAQLAARVYAGTGSSQINISCEVGSLTYTAQSAGIVTIDQNGLATAQQPGSTNITSNLSNAGASAGYFATCPPVSIALGIPQSNGTTTLTGIAPQNNAQPLSAVVTDIHGVQLTGVTLEYVTTTPQTIAASTSGTITPTLPGTTTVTAQCIPSSCNTAPFNSIGYLGNGQPITSNDVTLITPGTNSTQLFIASTQSQYIIPIDFTTPSLGAPVRLPYVPNSIALSDDGSTIYLGNAYEMMTFSAVTNGLTGEYPGVPGTVLAVSPDNSTVVVSDASRNLIYLATSTGSITTEIGGTATHAEFSPDSGTVYITDTAGSQLLVHSTFTGWHTIPLTVAPTDVAITVPAVGAYFAGASTTAVSYCANVTSTSGTTATSNFYPQVDSIGNITDRVAATSDGQHILGATVSSTPTLVDIKFPNPLPPTQACPVPVPANYFGNVRTGPTSIPLAGVTATAITGIPSTSDSAFAFVTYTGTGKLPQYIPATGAISYITLQGAATAPVAGVVSTDNNTFYVGTAGDNLVHILTRGASGFVDTTTPIIPNLPSSTGTTGPYATPNLIVQKPKKSTS